MPIRARWQGMPQDPKMRDDHLEYLQRLRQQVDDTIHQLESSLDPQSECDRRIMSLNAELAARIIDHFQSLIREIEDKQPKGND